MSFLARSLVRSLTASHAFGGPELWSSVGTTEGALSASDRNGGSSLGTFDAPHLPLHLDGESASRLMARGADSTDMPDTGVTRYYNFTVSYQTIAPDGVQKDGIVINGQYPGPLIEANWGDWISVTVYNELGAKNEGTSIHWHGLLQKETPWSDGVPGVTQCPIVPGQSLTYLFRADQYGTSWYHSHYSAQYSGGALGPMIIYGPNTTQYDVDLGPIMLSDWYHTDYYTLVEQTMAPAAEHVPPPVSDNNIMNGMGTFDCSQTSLPCTANAGVPKFKFQSGTSYRLRLINSGSDGTQKFSIDGHTLTVIANDFIPVNPYTATSVTLGVGQRTDVIVTADQDSSSAYWVRSNLGPGRQAGGCNDNNPDAQTAFGIIYYEDSDTTSVPESTAQPDSMLTYCGNDDLSKTTPLNPSTPPTPDLTVDIPIQALNNGTHNLFYMSGVTFRADYNDALLLSANQGDFNFPADANVHNYGTNSSVRLVVYNHNTMPHPMHLHGHDFWVLAEGKGHWDGNIVNPQNPQMRDTQLIQAGTDGVPSYIVIQYNLDHAQINPYHCHISWHNSAGFVLLAMENPAAIQALDIPDNIKNTCTAWATFTSGVMVDQIDSGLRKRINLGVNGAIATKE
ncbi:laccase [Phyllosticta capitalensis]